MIFYNHKYNGVRYLQRQSSSCAMAWHKCCYSPVRSHPMITLSEPASIKTCETISASTSHSAENDANSFERILQEHLPLVRSVVDRMKRKLPTALEVDELYSIGVSGLIAAARNYSQSKAASFASYASTRIRGAILDELRRSDWMSRRTRSKA